MIRKLLCSIAALVGINASISAVVVQKLVKTNDDVLYGFITVQNLDDYKIVFQADSSMETVDRVISSGGKRFVAFGDGSPIPVAKQRQKGNGQIVCTFKTVHNVEIKWDDVKAIFAMPDKKGTITGLEREYTTHDGSVYRGNFVKQTYGKDNFVELEAGGKTYEINLSKVTCYKTIRKNPAQPLAEQSKVLDIIEKKNGQWTEPGIIVERNYQSENPDSFYVLLHHANKAEERIYFGQIKRFRRVCNDGYKPYVINVLRKGEMMVNGKKVTHTVPFGQCGEAGKAKSMMKSGKAFAYKANKRVGLLGQTEEVINAYLPREDYMTALTTPSDTCLITFEVNDSVSDGLGAVGIVRDVSMSKDGKTMSISPFSLLQTSKAVEKPITDGKSGTWQYKFRIVLPRESKSNKTNGGKYYYAIYLPMSEKIIPLSVKRQWGRDIANKRKY